MDDGYAIFFDEFGLQMPILTLQNRTLGDSNFDPLNGVKIGPPVRPVPVTKTKKLKKTMKPYSDKLCNRETIHVVGSKYHFRIMLFKISGFIKIG